MNSSNIRFIFMRRIFDEFIFLKIFFPEKKRRIFDDSNIQRILSPFSALRNRRIFDSFYRRLFDRRIFEGFKNINFPFFVTKR